MENAMSQGNTGNAALALRPGNDLVATQETAISAVAAQARAMVESRYVMALRRPRNWDQVRQDVLHECKRPSFAHNKSAFYRKPIGAGVEGLGIRFVEVALRCMTNVLVETSMLYEDATKEVHRVSVTDLESNLTYPLDVRVSKTVERSKPESDGSYISVRMNSYNKPSYTVAATDDDLLNKRAALISKAIRTLGLRVIPGDIQDEAEAIIKQIRTDEAARDPEAERKKIADAFAEIGVKATQLAEYLGHDLGTCSPAELVDLRGIYGAIKDGEASWKQVMDNIGAETPKEGESKSGAASASIADLNAKIGAGKGKPVAKPQKSESSGNPPPSDGVQTVSTATDAQGSPLSYAEVADALAKATTVDALDLASDLIRGVASEQHRAELDVSARARRKALEGAEAGARG